MKFRYVKIMMVFLMLLLLAGCGGDDEGDKDEKAQSAESSQQESGMDDPIMDVLALVPDNEQSRLYVSYADYTAFVDSWLEPAADVIDFSNLNWSDEQQAEFDDFLERNELSLEKNSSLEILQAMMRENYEDFIIDAARYLASGVEFWLLMEDPLPGDVTVDMVHRSLQYGRPLEHGEILVGEFDVETIKAAYEEWDYQAESLDNGTYRMCLEGDCSTGRKLDRIAPLINVFGLDLGRLQPMLISPSVLASTLDEAVFENMVASYTGEGASLADAADIRAIVETATSYGRIYQMTLFPTIDIVTIPPLPVPGRGTTMEELQTLFDEVASEFEPFPQYSQIGMAHAVDESNDYGLVILLYDNQADAAAAADVIPRHIQDYRSVFSKRPLVDLFSGRADSWETAVFAATDYYATVLVFTTALPGVDSALIEDLSLEPADYGLEPSGLITASGSDWLEAVKEGNFNPWSFGQSYQLLVEMYIQQDTFWLAAELLPLEFDATPDSN